MFKSPKVTILRCGSDRVTGATFSRLADRLCCETWQEVNLGDRLVVGGSQWLEETQAAQRSLLEETGGSGAVGLVLAPTLTLLKHLQTPRVDERKRKRIVEFSAAQSMPFPLEQVEWDTVLSSDSVTAHHVLLAAVKRNVTDSLCAAVAACGREVLMILPSAAALLAAARSARLGEGESTLVLQLGARSATVLQLSGNYFAVRMILLAGDGVDRHAALQKLLLPEIGRTQIHFQSQLGFSRPNRLVLVSRAEVPAHFQRALEVSLKLPVTGSHLADPVNLSADVRLRGAEVNGGVAELAGAASHLFNPHQAVLNLLPGRLRTRQRSRRRKPWLVVAGCLAVVAPLVPLWQFHLLAEDARDRGNRLERELVGWRGRAAAVEVEQKRLVQLNRLNAAWEKAEARRYGWIQFLADLQDRLTEVEDVWLERLQPLPQAGTAPFKIKLDGWMLDRANPLKPTGPEILIRGKHLLNKLAGSPFVSAIEQERFDASKPGLLAFRCVLVIGSPEPL